MPEHDIQTTHPEEKSVFLAALDIEDPGQRIAWLDQTCGSDIHLRARVEALLRANEDETIVGPYVERESTPTPGRWQPPPPSELDPWLPGYTVTELLGRGGMGAVYRGVQQSLDREVAIKLLPPEMAGDPQFAARFEREAKAMAKLNHPNIVQIYDFGRTEGNHYYIVMEFVNGTDLHAYARSGKLTPEDALLAVGQICSALQYAHDKGFVHRDIKPANIFLSSEGAVKVGDFGLAKLVTTADVPDLTLSGFAVGTPNYIAPEQLSGDGMVDHRADLYSLGVMFYEMLTGELPRGAVKAPSEKSGNLDVRIDNVVFKAMESRPENRYQSATDLHSDVEAIRTSPTPAVETQKPTTKKSRKWFWIITTTVIELALIFWFFILPRLATNPPPTVPGSLHATGKMAVGSQGALVPVDISAAKGSADVIQIDGKFRGSWVALRSDGSVVAPKSFPVAPRSDIMRFGGRSGSTGNLYFLTKSGKVVSAIKGAGDSLIPDNRSRAIDLATHNGHGLVLYSNGRALPFGEDYKERSRFRPALSALTKIEKIAVGEPASVILKKDGSVAAWSREGYIKLPEVFAKDIVDIAVSTNPGVIGLTRYGRIYSASGRQIKTGEGKTIENAIRLSGGDNVYSPPLYQTADGAWHLFEEAKLRAAHPEVVAALANLKGLPPEAFHIRLDENRESEAYLLWIR